MNNAYFEWIVQQDLKTLTTADLDSAADETKLSLAAEYHVNVYKRHPVQFWNVIEMACVL